MIRPVIPHVYNFNVINIGFIVSAALMLTAAVIAALLAARYATNAFKGNKKKTTLCFVGIAICVTLALICFFGCAAITVKGIIFALILAFSSYEDIKKRECDDYLHLMIVIAAFIGTETAALPGMILAGIAAGTVMLVPSLLGHRSLGGADIKCAAVSVFLLGLRRGMIGLIVGLILAVAVNAVSGRKKKSEGFPLIPYLAVGFSTAYFM